MAQITISSSSSRPVVIGSSHNNSATITKSGTINAAGSYAVYAPVSFAATLANSGRLVASRGCGVQFDGGGSVTNGSAANRAALIDGGSFGVSLDARGGRVTNYGTIISGLSANSQYSGVLLGGNGIVVNGSTSDTTARISGVGNGVRANGTAVSIVNFGTILASGPTSYAIYLRSGGSITNGTAADASALIRGYEFGVTTTTDGATVTNFGTIDASSTAQSFGRAVHLHAGGTVINGSGSDTVASLIGAEGGVYINGPSNHGASGTTPSTVVNYGTITGDNLAGVYIRLGQNARVVNGSSGDTAARINGATDGVWIQGFTTASVTNFGTIAGGQAYGVYLTGGGVVTNGGTNDSVALIKGSVGVVAGGQIQTIVINFGTVSNGGGSEQALRLTSGGTVVNGSAGSARARIDGGVLIVAGSGRVMNFGTITGNIGVAFYRGLNQWITQTGSGTVVNSGVIESSSGSAGIAIKFGFGNERLVIDPGSVLVGKVVGGSGSNTLELASGKGSASIGSIGSNLTRFGPLVVDKGASWTLTGTNSLASGGTATLSGGASLDVTGRLAANGLTMSGSGNTLKLASPAGLAAPITGFGNGDTIDITGGVVTSLKFYAGVLTLSSGSRVMGTLRFAGGGLTGGSFRTLSDSRGGTKIVASGLSASAAFTAHAGDQAYAADGLGPTSLAFYHPGSSSPDFVMAGSPYPPGYTGSVSTGGYSLRGHGAEGGW